MGKVRLSVKIGILMGWSKLFKNRYRAGPVLEVRQAYPHTILAKVTPPSRGWKFVFKNWTRLPSIQAGKADWLTIQCCYKETQACKQARLALPSRAIMFMLDWLPSQFTSIERQTTYSFQLSKITYLQEASIRKLPIKDCPLEALHIQTFWWLFTESRAIC